MIIGITGTDGAGKGSVVDYLVQHEGFTHYASRDFIINEVEKRGLEATREQLRLVANDMRKQGGNDVIVKLAFEAIASERQERVIIESIRAIAEAETLKSHGGILISVDADPLIRYERIVGRGSSTDKISFAQFQAQEVIEMNDPDPNGMQKAKVMAMADFIILNNSTLTKLHQQIDVTLSEIGKRTGLK